MKTSRLIKMVVLAGALALAASCGNGSNGNGDTAVGEDTTQADVLAEVTEGDLVEQDLLSDVGEGVAPDPDVAVDPDQEGDSAEDTVEDTAVDIVHAPPVHPLFTAPEGVLVHDGLVFVTNTNGVYNPDLGKMVYGPGYVTVLDADDMEYVAQFETPFLNPQYLLPQDGHLAVICSGTIEFDESWTTASPVTPGGVALVDTATMEVIGDVGIPAGTPEPLAGFPGAAAWDAQGNKLYLGSGTSGYLFVVDLEALSPEDPIAVHAEPGAINDMILPEFVDGTIYAISGNEGLAHAIDPGTGDETGGPYDITETDENEAPAGTIVVDGILYVANSNSSSVAALDLDSGEVTFPFTTGAVPNRLAHYDGSLFVVNSLDNNLTKYDIGSGDVTQSFASFDPGTNPWDMAVADGAGYVTGYMTNNLVKVDLATGDIVATKGND